jgi:hypothetical protein
MLLFFKVFLAVYAFFCLLAASPSRRVFAWPYSLAEPQQELISEENRPRQNGLG